MNVSTRDRAPADDPVATGRPVAVLDIGSNSGRVVVLRLDPGGHLEVLEDARAPLRLVRDVDADNRLSPRAVERTLRALRDFAAIARGAGAVKIIAVATAAVREAANGPDLIAQVRAELGLEVAILDGEEEAHYAYLGAVHGLPVDHGLLIDIGGGSLEIVHFRDRRAVRSWMLPLGALRLSDRFLRNDPPAPTDLRRLTEHVRETVARAHVPALASDEALVGTGGTLRNLAKVDRRSRPYPIDRLHGYMLSRRRLKDLVESFATRKTAARALLPGLNKDRAESVLGGALAAHTLFGIVAGDEMQISGQGLREGLAIAIETPDLPPADDVRRASLAALTARFARSQTDAAARRTRLALDLLAILDPVAPEEPRTTLSDASTVLDVGRTVNYYGRHDHTAAIVATTDLVGFSHRALALIAATIRLAGDEKISPKLYRPLVTAADEPGLARLGTILALADAIERRSPPDRPLVARFGRRGQDFAVTVPLPAGWRSRPLEERVARDFGLTLRIVTTP